MDTRTPLSSAAHPRRSPSAHQPLISRPSRLLRSGLLKSPLRCLVLVAACLGLLYSIKNRLLDTDRMSKSFTLKDVSAHKSADSAWLVVENGVYDVTDFLEEHPGGKKVLLSQCGKDATEKFWQFHSKKVLEKSAKPFLIGTGAPFSLLSLDFTHADHLLLQSPKLPSSELSYVVP
ncbi:hypothetical protein JCM8097_002691 [Rhodosporidiobolus ruineniae]